MDCKSRIMEYAWNMNDISFEDERNMNDISMEYEWKISLSPLMATVKQCQK